MTYSKMVPSVKKKWIAALLSGKYKQGTGALRVQCAGKHLKYCCLGVLSGPVLGNKSTGGDLRDILDLPEETHGVSDDAQNFLTDANDDKRWTFKEIAAWIKKNI